MENFMGVLGRKYWAFTCNLKAFLPKLVVQGLVISSILLLLPLLAWAKGGLYNGSTPSGWFIDDDVPGFTDSLHAGVGFSSNNFLNFQSGTLSGSVFGGWSTSGNAENNTVLFFGGTVNNIYSGWSQSGDVSGNSVFMYGGTVGSTGATGGDLYGGFTNFSKKLQLAIIIR